MIVTELAAALAVLLFAFLALRLLCVFAFSVVDDYLRRRSR